MRRLVTRRRLAELNAQDWADFLAHWPMRVLDLLHQTGMGFIFGAAVGMAAGVWVHRMLVQA